MHKTLTLYGPRQNKDCTTPETRLSEVEENKPRTVFRFVYKVTGKGTLLKKRPEGNVWKYLDASPILLPYRCVRRREAGERM